MEGLNSPVRLVGCEAGKGDWVTTEMIRLWSMQGAERNGDGEERSADDLRAALASRWTSSADERLRMRGAGEDEWKPLLTGIEGEGEQAPGDGLK